MCSFRILFSYIIMKRFITAIGFVCLLSACGSDSEESAADNSVAYSGEGQSTLSTAESLNQEALVGTYVGRLPCETCDAMVTSIILKEDNTYAITTKPENDSVFTMPLVDSGSFVMRNNILELTDKAGEIRQYRIEGAKLIQLDDKGQPLKAQGENQYIFERH